MWLNELVFVKDLKVWRLLSKKSSESWKFVLWCWWVIIKWIKDPKQWVKVKRKNLWCIKLSVGSHMDTYEPLDRPVRMIIISNKFLWKQSCFPKSSCASERKILQNSCIVTFPRQNSVGKLFNNVWTRSVHAWFVWIMHRCKVLQHLLYFYINVFCIYFFLFLVLDTLLNLANVSISLKIALFRKEFK